MGIAPFPHELPEDLEPAREPASAEQQDQEPEPEPEPPR
jgi:hypothetical protein